jgi:putative membrane protein
MPRVKTLAALALALQATACTTTAQAPPQTTLSTQDLNAVTTAYQLIQFDLAECLVLVPNGASPRIAALGAHICQDATIYQAKLQAVAQADNITLPTSLRYDLNSEYVQLHYHVGAGTDIGYLRDQIGSHEAALAIFEDESVNGTDPQVKAISTAAVPVVQGNLNDLQAALVATQ